MFVFSGNIIKSEKPATWPHSAGAVQQLLTFSQVWAPGVSVVASAYFAHQTSCQVPACICIGDPGFKESRHNAGLSMPHSISTAKKKKKYPTTKILAYLTSVRKKLNNGCKLPGICCRVLTCSYSLESPEEL